MKLTQIKEKKYLQTISEKSIRATTFSDLWESKELTFNKVKKEAGIETATNLITVEVFKMCDLINAELKESQLDYLVRYIQQNFGYFTISDLTIIADRLVLMKQYGKPSLPQLVQEINQYDIERSSFAEDYNTQEKEEKEKELKKNEEFIRKAYENMKDPKPKKSQKEKDREAVRQNKERISEMKKMGLLK